MSEQLSSSLVVILLFFCMPAVGQITLTVAAASDLTDLEPSLGAQFRKYEPNSNRAAVRFVTASSAILSQQIENGAPYDVFMSANAAFVERLASSRNLLPQSVHVYAVGRVAVLWRDRKHHSLNDLSAASVKFLALPNPKLAPYGVAAPQALEHAGVWGVVQPKVVYGENVRQTLQLFDSGNADAVITSDSLLIARNPDLIPSGWHQPIIQKAGIVASSSFRKNAEAFLDFLLSPAAQAIYAQYGFGPPPKS